MKVNFHPEAGEEVEASRQWYAERNPLVARAFLAEIDLAVARIEEAPQRWPSYGKAARRYILPRFPFSVIYRIKDERIEVVAVAHNRRKPGYWNGSLVEVIFAAGPTRHFPLPFSATSLDDPPRTDEPDRGGGENQGDSKGGAWMNAPER